MTALATSADVEVAIGRTLTADETARADQLILTASAYVAEVTGARLAPGSYTVGRKGRTKLRLPGKVATVAAVREIDQSDGAATTLTVTDDYTLHGSTLYGLGARCFVEVDFTITEAAPDEIVALVAGMVAATLEAPSANVASESVGPFSRSFVGSSGRVYLSESDKAVLRRYTRPRAALDLLG